MFIEYFKLGINHILDLSGLDHFYFIVAFSLLYSLSDWKVVLKLVTAFTLGHSLTLILATLGYIQFNIDFIEILITVTIVLTCLKNYYQLYGNTQKKELHAFNYLIIAGFGLIHGMGFSSFIKQMLFDDESLIKTLMAFNLGIEFAQILIVMAFLTFMTLILSYTKHKKLLKVIVNTIILVLVIQLLF